jgi:short-subunit dehydrogenase
MRINLKQKYGPTALVAGASEGIGAAFAIYLASEGIDLVLVARRMEPLEELAARLEDQYNINVSCIPCDLSHPDAINRVADALNGREINILVYNAALSFIGKFTSVSSEEQSAATRVNMVTPLNLVRFFGEKMLGKGKGAIILMSSLAGFQGSGFLSLYAATKAFNRILAESLWYEWKNTGVDIIGCCAGATATPGYLNTSPEKSGFFTPRVLDPAEIPPECFRMLGKQPSWITGRSNRIASFIMQKILPRKTAINLMGDTTRKMYRL